MAPQATEEGNAASCRAKACSGAFMRRYEADGGIPTLEIALSEFMNAEDLKRLGALTGQRLPSRKLDLVQVIIRHLEGDRLRALWQGLDQIDRAAVAEVVHSDSTRFPACRFSA